jgi:hypothetical protein
MKKYFFIALILFSGVLHAQIYLLANEELIFSFNTKNGKHVVLAKDKNNSYIIYRFGTASKIEFEFPGRSRESWLKVKYAFYLRGGGIQNDGMDLNYIYFSNNDFKYTIYDTYTTEDQKSDLGVRVTDLKTNKTTDIRGVYKSRKGTLAGFRDNNLLEITDDPGN